MNKSRRDSNGLNKRERDILKFIQKEIITNGFAPSVREICKAVGLNSTATVQGYLKVLEERGYVKKENQKGRTIRLLKNFKGENVVSDALGVSATKEYYSNKEMVNVPLVGKITAGQPILAVENITDTFPIPIDFVVLAKFLLVEFVFVNDDRGVSLSLIDSWKNEILLGVICFDS